MGISHRHLRFSHDTEWRRQARVAALSARLSQSVCTTSVVETLLAHLSVGRARRARCPGRVRRSPPLLQGSGGMPPILINFWRIGGIRWYMSTMPDACVMTAPSCRHEHTNLSSPTASPFVDFTKQKCDSNSLSHCVPETIFSPIL